MHFLHLVTHTAIRCHHNELPLPRGIKTQIPSAVRLRYYNLSKNLTIEKKNVTKITKLNVRLNYGLNDRNRFMNLNFSFSERFIKNLKTNLFIKILLSIVVYVRINLKHTSIIPAFWIRTGRSCLL